MAKKNKRKIFKLNPWIFFWIFLLLMFILNFIGKVIFGITHLWWHLFLHMGIIIFSFFMLIYSIKLNEKARKFVIIGCMLWILVESVLFLSHIFEEYYWLETNIILWAFGILGIFMLMKGFKEAIK